MRTTTFIASLALIAALAFVGCGYDVPGHEIIDDDFQAGNMLTVTSITDTSGHSVPIFKGVQKTDDLGRDGIPDTDDEGEDDGYPDSFEELLEKLSDDLATITLENETRLGVAEGVDLHVFRVDVTYYDNNGNSRTFAPRQSFDITGVIPADSEATLEIVLIPVDIKINGLRDALLTGTLAERDAVRQWTVVVDVYARDTKNDDTVHAQGGTTVRFINPMVEEIVQ